MIILLCLLITHSFQDHAFPLESDAIDTIYLIDIVGDIRVIAHDRGEVLVNVKPKFDNENWVPVENGGLKFATIGSSLKITGTTQNSNRITTIHLPQAPALICQLKSNRDVFTLVYWPGTLEFEGLGCDIFLENPVNSFAIMNAFGDVEISLGETRASTMGYVTTGSGNVRVKLSRSSNVAVTAESPRGDISNKTGMANDARDQLRIGPHNADLQMTISTISGDIVIKR